MQQESVDKRSEQTSHQSQNPRRSRTDRQGQANQGAATQSQQTSAQKQFLQGSTEHSQLPQQMQQIHSQIYREYRDPYAYYLAVQPIITHMTQQLGSYLISSPRSAMTSISSGQPGHITMTAIVGNLPHSKPTMVTQTGGGSNKFEEFAQPELDIQNGQQAEANEEIQNLKQQSN